MPTPRPASYHVRQAVYHVVKAAWLVRPQSLYASAKDYHLLRQTFATLDSLSTRMRAKKGAS